VCAAGSVCKPSPFQHLKCGAPTCPPSRAPTRFSRARRAICRHGLSCSFPRPAARFPQRRGRRKCVIVVPARRTISRPPPHPPRSLIISPSFPPLFPFVKSALNHSHGRVLPWRYAGPKMGGRVGRKAVRAAGPRERGRGREGGVRGACVCALRILPAAPDTPRSPKTPSAPACMAPDPPPLVGLVPRIVRTRRLSLSLLFCVPLPSLRRNVARFYRGVPPPASHTHIVIMIRVRFSRRFRRRPCGSCGRTRAPRPRS
jgi:hypothetical protein